MAAFAVMCTVLGEARHLAFAGGGGGWSAMPPRRAAAARAAVNVATTPRSPWFAPGRGGARHDTTHASSLAAVASLRSLLEQQRLSTPQAAQTTPGAAHLRALAHATLIDAAVPVADDLAAAREAATAAVRAAIEARQHPRDCASARLLVGSIDKACGFACEVRGESRSFVLVLGKAEETAKQTKHTRLFFSPPTPQIHHAVHLLATALATNRTLVLYTENWRYGNTEADNEAYAAATVRGEPPPRRPPITATGTHSEGLWSSLFQPITHCVTPGEEWVGSLPPLLPSTADAVAHERAVVAGLVDGAPFDWDPPSVPPDVFRLVAPFHARPEVWYAGVLADWLMRPAGARDAARREWAASVGLSERSAAKKEQQASPQPYKPYIGVHVRRTDKIVSLMDVSTGQQTTPEAAGTALDEYIAAAEAAWAAGRATADPTTPWPRHPTIYLATDDDTVLEEVKRGHPHITFVSHPVGASTAHAFATRATPTAAVGIADDIHFLSHAVFLVGSFSSQVSRLAYELAQVVGPAAHGPAADASLTTHSVDAAWYAGGGPRLRFCATVTFASRRVRVDEGDALLCGAAAGPSTAADDGGVPCRTVVSGADVMVPAGLMARCADNWRGRRVLGGAW